MIKSLLFPTERSALVCEGGKQTIVCDKQKIEIISSSFGRTNRDICQWGLDWMVAWAWNVNCRAENSLNVTKGECEGLSRCVLYSNSEEYGNPCIGTKKYLKVIIIIIIIISQLIQKLLKILCSSYKKRFNLIVHLH